MEPATSPLPSMDSTLRRQQQSADGIPADAFSRQLLVAMHSFREGNFAVRLPHDLTGVEGKIADAFNDIVTMSERRARETARPALAIRTASWHGPGPNPAGLAAGLEARRGKARPSALPDLNLRSVNEIA